MTNRLKLTLPYVESFLSLAETLDFEKREILVLEPEVTPEFNCSACGECCQRPWSVPVSEAYYQKWEPILAGDPSKRFTHAFALYDSPTSKRYANIARKPFSHECIFLDDDRKCFIQKTHGEEALSDVCKKYPRYEQWQGAFMGRFLAAGCPDVSQLLMDYPDIYAYRAVFKERPWKNINQKLHPLGVSNAYAWCGLSLDLAYHPHYTAIQNALRINQVLKEILKRGIDQHSPAYFRELGREAAQGKLPFEEAYDKSRAKKWLLHFSTFLPVLRSFLQQIEHGTTAIQPLDPEERELLNSFMRRCLMYRMLTTRPDLSAPFSGFFKSYFEVALQLVMLQWLALYYRERDQEALNRHHLARAFTQISYRIESNPQVQNTQELKQMPAAMILEGIDVLLSYDLGQASPLAL